MGGRRRRVQQQQEEDSRSILHSQQAEERQLPVPHTHQEETTRLAALQQQEEEQQKASEREVRQDQELRESEEDAEDDIWTFLASLSLEDVAHRLVKDLSGGMRRRVMVALCLLFYPKLCVLDEPSSGLDPAHREGLFALLHLVRPRSCVVVSTQHTEDAEALADRVGVMHEGRLLCVGTPFELRRRFGGGYRLRVLLEVSSSSACGSHQPQANPSTRPPGQPAVADRRWTSCPASTVAHADGVSGGTPAARPAACVAAAASVFDPDTESGFQARPACASAGPSSAALSPESAASASSTTAVGNGAGGENIPIVSDAANVSRLVAAKLGTCLGFSSARTAESLNYRVQALLELLETTLNGPDKEQSSTGGVDASSTNAGHNLEERDCEVESHRAGGANEGAAFAAVSGRPATTVFLPSPCRSFRRAAVHLESIKFAASADQCQQRSTKELDEVDAADYIASEKRRRRGVATEASARSPREGSHTGGDETKAREDEGLEKKAKAAAHRKAGRRKGGEMVLLRESDGCIQPCSDSGPAASGARMPSFAPNSCAEVTLRVSPVTAGSLKLSPALRALRAAEERLGITSFGIYAPSMRDVFVNVCSQAYSQELQQQRHMRTFEKAGSRRGGRPTADEHHLSAETELPVAAATGAAAAGRAQRLHATCHGSDSYASAGGATAAAAQSDSGGSSAPAVLAAAQPAAKRIQRPQQEHSVSSVRARSSRSQEFHSTEDEQQPLMSRGRTTSVGAPSDAAVTSSATDSTPTTPQAAAIDADGASAAVGSPSHHAGARSGMRETQGGTPEHFAAACHANEDEGWDTALAATALRRRRRRVVRLLLLKRFLFLRRSSWMTAFSQVFLPPLAVTTMLLLILYLTASSDLADGQPLRGTTCAGANRETAGPLGAFERRAATRLGSRERVALCTADTSACQLGDTGAPPRASERDSAPLSMDPEAALDLPFLTPHDMATAPPQPLQLMQRHSMNTTPPKKGDSTFSSGKDSGTGNASGASLDCLRSAESGSPPEMRSSPSPSLRLRSGSGRLLSPSSNRNSDSISSLSSNHRNPGGAGKPGKWLHLLYSASSESLRAAAARLLNSFGMDATGRQLRDGPTWSSGAPAPEEQVARAAVPVQGARWRTGGARGHHEPAAERNAGLVNPLVQEVLSLGEQGPCCVGMALEHVPCILTNKLFKRRVTLVPSTSREGEFILQSPVAYGALRQFSLQALAAEEAAAAAEAEQQRSRSAFFRVPLVGAFFFSREEDSVLPANEEVAGIMERDEEDAAAAGGARTAEAAATATSKLLAGQNNVGSFKKGNTDKVLQASANRKIEASVTLKADRANSVAAPAVTVAGPRTTTAGAEREGRRTTVGNAALPTAGWAQPVAAKRTEALAQRLDEETPAAASHLLAAATGAGPNPQLLLEGKAHVSGNTGDGGHHGRMQDLSSEERRQTSTDSSSSRAAAQQQGCLLRDLPQAREQHAAQSPSDGYLLPSRDTAAFRSVGKPQSVNGGVASSSSNGSAVIRTSPSDECTHVPSVTAAATSPYASVTSSQAAATSAGIARPLHREREVGGEAETRRPSGQLLLRKPQLSQMTALAEPAAQQGHAEGQQAEQQDRQKRIPQGEQRKKTLVAQMSAGVAEGEMRRRLTSVESEHCGQLEEAPEEAAAGFGRDVSEQEQQQHEAVALHFGGGQASRKEEQQLQDTATVSFAAGQPKDEQQAGTTGDSRAAASAGASSTVERTRSQSQARTEGEAFAAKPEETTAGDTGAGLTTEEINDVLAVTADALRSSATPLQLAGTEESNAVASETAEAARGAHGMTAERAAPAAAETGSGGLSALAPLRSKIAAIIKEQRSTHEGSEKQERLRTPVSGVAAAADAKNSVQGVQFGGDVLTLESNVGEYLGFKQMVTFPPEGALTVLLLFSPEQEHALPVLLSSFMRGLLHEEQMLLHKETQYLKRLIQAPGSYATPLGSSQPAHSDGLAVSSALRSYQVQQQQHQLQSQANSETQQEQRQRRESLHTSPAEQSSEQEQVGNPLQTPRQYEQQQQNSEARPGSRDGQREQRTGDILQPTTKERHKALLGDQDRGGSPRWPLVSFSSGGGTENIIDSSTRKDDTSSSSDGSATVRSNIYSDTGGLEGAARSSSRASPTDTTTSGTSPASNNTFASGMTRSQDAGLHREDVFIDKLARSLLEGVSTHLKEQEEQEKKMSAISTAAENFGGDIPIVNQPLPLTLMLSGSRYLENVDSFLASVSVLFAFCSMPATIVNFLAAEASSQLKFLEFSAGVAPSTYWLTSFLFDFVTFCLSLILTLLVLLAFRVRLIMSYRVRPALLLLLLGYGAASVAHSSFFSLCVHAFGRGKLLSLSASAASGSSSFSSFVAAATSSYAQPAAMIFNVLLSPAVALLTYAMQLLSYVPELAFLRSTAHLISNVSRVLSPSFSLSHALLLLPLCDEQLQDDDSFDVHVPHVSYTTASSRKAAHSTAAGSEASATNLGGTKQKPAQMGYAGTARSSWFFDTKAEDHLKADGTVAMCDSPWAPHAAAFDILFLFVDALLYAGLTILVDAFTLWTTYVPPEKSCMRSETRCNNTAQTALRRSCAGQGRSSSSDTHYTEATTTCSNSCGGATDPGTTAHPDDGDESVAALFNSSVGTSRTRRTLYTCASSGSDASSREGRTPLLHSGAAGGDEGALRSSPQRARRSIYGGNRKGVSWTLRRTALLMLRCVRLCKASLRGCFDWLLPVRPPSSRSSGARPPLDNAYLVRRARVSSSSAPGDAPSHVSFANGGRGANAAVAAAGPSGPLHSLGAQQEPAAGAKSDCLPHSEDTVASGAALTAEGSATGELVTAVEGKVGDRRVDGSGAADVDIAAGVELNEPAAEALAVLERRRSGSRRQRQQELRQASVEAEAARVQHMSAAEQQQQAIYAFKLEKIYLLQSELVASVRNVLRGWCSRQVSKRICRVLGGGPRRRSSAASLAAVTYEAHAPRLAAGNSNHGGSALSRCSSRNSRDTSSASSARLCSNSPCQRRLLRRNSEEGGGTEHVGRATSDAASRFCRGARDTDASTKSVVEAVKRLTFAAREGEVIALVGQNGAGKSTMLRMLCGLELPDCGIVRIGRRAGWLRTSSEQCSNYHGHGYDTSSSRYRSSGSRADRIVALSGGVGSSWCSGGRAGPVSEEGWQLVVERSPSWGDASGGCKVLGTLTSVGARDTIQGAGHRPSHAAGCSRAGGELQLAAVAHASAVSPAGGQGNKDIWGETQLQPPLSCIPGAAPETAGEVVAAEVTCARDSSRQCRRAAQDRDGSDRSSGSRGLQTHERRHLLPTGEQHGSSGDEEEMQEVADASALQGAGFFRRFPQLSQNCTPYSNQQRCSQEGEEEDEAQDGEETGSEQRQRGDGDNGTEEELSRAADTVEAQMPEELNGVAAGSLGICPQEDTLWDFLTPREHLQLFAAIRNALLPCSTGACSVCVDFATRAWHADTAYTEAELEREVEETLAAVQLLPHAEKRAERLSGGMRRKLSLAMAAVCQPAVLLLDEPTCGLDPIARLCVGDLIRKKTASPTGLQPRSGLLAMFPAKGLQQAWTSPAALQSHETCQQLYQKPQHGVVEDHTQQQRIEKAERLSDRPPSCVLLSSHAMEEVEALASRVLVMDKGQLFCTGTPQQISDWFSPGLLLTVQLPPPSLPGWCSSSEGQDHVAVAAWLLQSSFAPEKMPQAQQDVATAPVARDVSAAGADLPSTDHLPLPASWNQWSATATHLEAPTAGHGPAVASEMPVTLAVVPGEAPPQAPVTGNLCEQQSSGHQRLELSDRRTAEITAADALALCMEFDRRQALSSGCNSRCDAEGGAANGRTDSRLAAALSTSSPFHALLKGLPLPIVVFVEWWLLEDMSLRLLGLLRSCTVVGRGSRGWQGNGMDCSDVGNPVKIPHAGGCYGPLSTSHSRGRAEGDTSSSRIARSASASPLCSSNSRRNNSCARERSLYNGSGGQRRCLVAEISSSGPVRHYAVLNPPYASSGRERDTSRLTFPAADITSPAARAASGEPLLSSSPKSSKSLSINKCGTAEGPGGHRSISHIKTSDPGMSQREQRHAEKLDVTPSDDPASRCSASSCGDAQRDGQADLIINLFELLEDSAHVRSAVGFAPLDFTVTGTSLHQTFTHLLEELEEEEDEAH